MGRRAVPHFFCTLIQLFIQRPQQRRLADHSDEAFCSRSTTSNCPGASPAMRII
jgi:hypothetical protein